LTERKKEEILSIMMQSIQS